jgi:hypothetical protein
MTFPIASKTRYAIALRKLIPSSRFSPLAGKSGETKFKCPSERYLVQVLPFFVSDNKAFSSH